MVRIAGSHPADPGSIPGVGNLFSMNVEDNCPRVILFYWFHYQGREIAENIIKAAKQEHLSADELHSKDAPYVLLIDIYEL